MRQPAETSPHEGQRPVGTVDVEALLGGWERMSEHYLSGRGPLREEIVELVAAHLADRSGVVVELGSGPGTLLDQLADACPTAHLVGTEIDPVLRRLHELGPAGGHRPRVRLADGVDLSDPGWVRAVPGPGAVDVVVAVQVLHYFAPARFAALLDEIRSVLAPGGLFVHLDHVPPTDPGHDSDRDGRSSEDDDSGEGTDSEDRAANGDGEAMAPAAGDDPWTAWWASARRCSILDEAMRERDRWLDSGPAPSAEYHPHRSQLRDAFAGAGLGSVLHEHRLGGSLLTVTGAPGG